MTDWRRIGRAVTGSIGLLGAAYCGLLTLLVVGFATPVQSHEAGEGYGTLLMGLVGVGVALVLAATSSAMFRSTASRWHLRCALVIAGVLAVGAASVGWLSLSEVAAERERLLTLSGLLGGSAMVVALLGRLSSRAPAHQRT